MNYTEHAIFGWTVLAAVLICLTTMATGQFPAIPGRRRRS